MFLARRVETFGDTIHIPAGAPTFLVLASGFCSVASSFCSPEP
jgi:hypothetical protein